MIVTFLDYRPKETKLKFYIFPGQLMKNENNSGKNGTGSISNTRSWPTNPGIATCYRLLASGIEARESLP